MFYKPGARRWSFFKLMSLALVVIVLSLLGLLTAAVLVQVSLPRARLPIARALAGVNRPLWRDDATMILRSDYSLLKAKEQLDRYLKRRSEARQVAPVGGTSFEDAEVQSRPSSAGAETESVAEPSRTSVIGFYVDWDRASFTSLKENIDRLDELMPEWLHLATRNGRIVQDDPYMEAQTLAFVRQRRPDLPVVPLVNNFSNRLGDFDGRTLAAMLSNAGARRRTIEQLLQFVTGHRLRGVNIDFENVPAASQRALALFMRELYGVFHPRGLEVSEDVPIDDPQYNCAVLARSADFLVLMAYDQHCSGSAAGPIAAQSWYLNALARRFSQAAPSKYVIGLGSYGYDWTGRSTSAADLTYAQVLSLAQAAQAAIRLDPLSLNPTFEYFDAQHRLHHVWFLDAVTLWNEIEQVRPFLPRGFALWRLGSEDPSIWRIFDQRSTPPVDPSGLLRSIPCGSGVDLKGGGQVLGVSVASVAPGEREITYNSQLNQIVAEHVVAYPSEYVVDCWGGGHPHQIALTFDDGPNPPYTGQILDILRRYRAPATFFIIGQNGIAHPDLLRQIVAQGDEIGNHTFTHPDVSLIPAEQLQLELNATQRLIESATGRRTILFRPPYGQDSEPTTPAELAPLVTASKMGYLSVGIDIDPNDWSRPGVSAIVNSVLSQAEAGVGSVVLLHDGGGDRSQTVAALPAIIRGLRAHGFQLVSISDLLGVPRSAVNPPAPGSVFVAASGWGFRLLDVFNSIIVTLFIVGIALGILWLTALVVLAVAGWRQSRRARYVADYQPAVAVVVPAYNEEAVIGATLQALLASRYPALEIIVVDDGSTDETAKRALAAAGDDPRVRVLTKPNGGKASALNYGIERTTAEVIVALDADTIFAPDTIMLLARHFADPRVGAVAGNAKVGNRVNLLTRWQALEYITSQNLDRRAFARLNCITVVPGSVGAWRRTSVVAAGGFSPDTVAEDADLTLSILRMGQRVDYEDAAVGFTEAPETVRAFAGQRLRWVFGTLQAYWKHRSAMFRPGAGAVGMLALPQAVIFKILFPLLAPLMDLAALGSFGLLISRHFEHPEDGWNQGLVRLLIYCGLFVAADHLAAAVALLLEDGEDWALLPWLLLQRFFYRQLLSYVAARSVLRAIRGELVGWGKLVRRGTVARAALAGTEVPKDSS